MLLLILACTLSGSGEIKIDSGVCIPNISNTCDTAPSDDTGDTGTPPDPLTWAYSFSTDESNNQLYGIEHVDGPNFIIYNPYCLSFQGCIYSIDMSQPIGILETDAVATWTGDSLDLLGVNAVIATDGSTKYVCSQTYGIDESGRLLCAPVSSGSGLLASYATLDIDGDSPGDYFGTGIASNAGELLVSGTTIPSLRSGSTSLLSTGGVLGDFTVNSNIPVDTSSSAGDGYLIMRIVPGSDGYVLVSCGGIFQHIGTDGVPDWFILIDGTTGSGALTDAELGGRDTSNRCFGKRLAQNYALSCLETNNQSTTIIVSPDGNLIDTLSDVVDIAEGSSNGQAWTAYSHTDGFENSTQEGWLEVRDSDDTPFILQPFPFEAPYTCPAQIATDGNTGIGLICHGYSFGAYGTLPPL